MHNKYVTKALEDLEIKPNLYKAGFPSYISNFSRDSFTYALLANDIDALLAQIEFSSRFQGIDVNPEDGEEPGKIHHEMPGILINGLHATYNGCDTTAMYLIAIEKVFKLSGSSKILDDYKPSIQAAIKYIKSHVHENLFWEDPSQVGADRFALKVTYWKDSELNREDSDPHYPIVYSLAHFQNALALKLIGSVLTDNELVDLSDKMFRAGMELLWLEDHFVTAVEQGGKIFDPPSTDSLHSLLYIDPFFISSEKTQKIVDYSTPLETIAGYRTGIPQPGNTDAYHTQFVWTHEQALLHAAAKRHDLDKPQSITKRIKPYINDSFPELLDVKMFKPAGNTLQLWTIGAHIYFQNNS